MSDWIIRIIYIVVLVLGINLYGYPQRYERLWRRFGPNRAHTLSRIAGVVPILISVLFIASANVFLT